MTDESSRKSDDDSPTPETHPDVRSSSAPQHRRSGDDATGQMSRMQEIFASAMQFGPARHPLQDKITEGHITEILSINREGMQSFAKDREGERKHHTTLCLIACGFVLILVALFIFSGNAALTEKILISLVSLAAGAFGGYGYGSRKRE
jgi:hypothetical protein